ncbi:MAG TPA: endonuclease/exonuclease/phosphatase family protein [Hyphomicrobiaceae bacterium]|nr:endonuclease/exonuclease/phosphatase family protein [Hyphomicrobiaceae bacterium]
MRGRGAQTGRFSVQWWFLFLLAAASLALIFIIAAGLTPLSEAFAPVAGHVFGLGMSASVALVLRRWMLGVLTLGLGATIAAHAWMGTERCCRPPAPLETGAIVAAAAQPSALNIVSVNAARLAAGETAGMRRYLLASRADVIILSELGSAKPALLDTLRRAYPFQVQCEADPPCALAIVSRVPLGGGGAAQIATSRQPFVWAKVKALRADAGAVTVVGTHLDSPDRDPWRHESQMTALSQFVRRIDGPIVVAGDLNISPWSKSFRTLRMRTGLAPAGMLLPSWPAWPLPQVALDNIFVSPEIAVTAAGTGPAVGSTHLPVWARLQREPFALERSRTPRWARSSRLAVAAPHLRAQLLADFGREHAGAGNLGGREPLVGGAL